MRVKKESCNMQSLEIGKKVHARDVHDSMIGHVRGIERSHNNVPISVLIEDPLSERVVYFNLLDSLTCVHVVHELPN